MPAIAAPTAPVLPAAPPAVASGAPAAGDNSFNNQSFDDVLVSHLEEGADLTLEPESPPMPDPVFATPPVLAVDGKVLPPDIAALIAASQPVVSEQGVVAAPALTLAAAGQEAGEALARAPLSAALAALTARDPDTQRSLRLPVSAGQDVKTAVKGDTQKEHTLPTFALGNLLADADAADGPTPMALLKAGLSPKDLALALIDARGQTPSAPISHPLSAAGMTTPSLTTATPAAPIAPSIPLPFAQPGWEQGLGNRVMWMVNQQVQTAELRMNPAHLGPLEVRISIRDDQASVSFVSAHGHVREALQAAIPQLRDMLGENGLNLSNVNISQHSFADARQRPDHPSSDAGNGQGNSASGELQDEAPLALVRLGLVDDYA